MFPFDERPEVCIIVGLGRLVASIAVSLFCRRVPESFYFPRADAVAFPAVLSEKPSMLVEVTLGAQQFIIEKSVIYVRDIGCCPPVLHMATQAASLRLVEADFRRQPFYINKFMAL
jgi:hypothetical protein